MKKTDGKWVSTDMRERKIVHNAVRYNGNVIIELFADTSCEREKNLIY